MRCRGMGQGKPEVSWGAGGTAGQVGRENGCFMEAGSWEASVKDQRVETGELGGWRLRWSN